MGWERLHKAFQEEIPTACRGSLWVQQDEGSLGAKKNLQVVLLSSSAAGSGKWRANCLQLSLVSSVLLLSTKLTYFI